MSGGSGDGGAERRQREDGRHDAGRRDAGGKQHADGQRGPRDAPQPRGGQLPYGWPQPVPAVRAARLGVYVALLVLGVLAGVAGSLVQSGWFPGGLLLALAGAVGLFWGGAKLCRTRVGAAAPGAGWAVTVVLLTTARPEGDFLFGAGIGSYVFLLGGMLAAVMCATIALPAPPVPGHKYR